MIMNRANDETYWDPNSYMNTTSIQNTIVQSYNVGLYTFNGAMGLIKPSVNSFIIWKMAT